MSNKKTPGIDRNPNINEEEEEIIHLREENMQLEIEARQLRDQLEYYITKE